MSHTDKTRPGWVQEKDPLNQRFRRITGEDWFYKKMFALHQCWCCSQKRYWAQEQASERAKWRQEKRSLEKGAWRDET